MMSNRELYRFLAITFAAAYLGQFVVVSMNVEGPARFGLMLVMWTPGLATLLAGPASRRRAWSSLTVLARKMLLPALMLGWSVTLLQGLLLAIGSQATWNSALFPLISGQV